MSYRAWRFVEIARCAASITSLPQAWQLLTHSAANDTTTSRTAKDAESMTESDMDDTLGGAMQAYNVCSAGLGSLYGSNFSCQASAIKHCDIYRPISHEYTLNLQKDTAYFDSLKGEHVFITPEELLQLQKMPGVRVFEAGYNGAAEYSRHHIVGAEYIDTTELESESNDWSTVSEQELRDWLGRRGLRADNTVVLYSRVSMAAARIAHILHFAGIHNIYLLDGNWEHWIESGLHMEGGAPPPVPVKVASDVGDFRLRQNVFTDIQHVRHIVNTLELQHNATDRERYYIGGAHDGTVDTVSFVALPAGTITDIDDATAAETPTTPTTPTSNTSEGTHRSVCEDSSNSSSMSATRGEGVGSSKTAKHIRLPDPTTTTTNNTNIDNQHNIGKPAHPVLQCEGGNMHAHMRVGEPMHCGPQNIHNTGTQRSGPKNSNTDNSHSDSQNGDQAPIPVSSSPSFGARARTANGTCARTYSPCLVSIRSAEEYLGLTSGYSYIPAKGDIPHSLWGGAGHNAQRYEITRR